MATAEVKPTVNTNLDSMVYALDTPSVVPYVDPATGVEAADYVSAFDPTSPSNVSPSNPDGGPITPNLVSVMSNFGYSSGATATTPLIPVTATPGPTLAGAAPKPSNLIIILGVAVAGYFGFKYFKKGRV